MNDDQGWPVQPTSESVSRQQTFSLAASAGYRIGYESQLHPWMCLVDLTHVLALNDRDAIPSDATVKLLSALLDIVGHSPHEVFADRWERDGNSLRGHLLQVLVGDDSGWLHVGRTEHETARTAFYLAARDAALGLHGEVARFAGAVLTRSLDQAETQWADQACVHHGHLTSFGGYLLSFAHQASRHLDRLKQVRERCANVPSPDGSGPNAEGRRTAHLDRLGLAATATTLRDSLWCTDVLIDLAVAATHCAMTSSQLAEDLMLFASPGRDYVRLRARPQHSPSDIPSVGDGESLAAIRGGTSQLIGALTGVITSARTPSAQIDNWMYAYSDVLRMLGSARRLSLLSGDAISFADFDRTRIQAVSLAIIARRPPSAVPYPPDPGPGTQSSLARPGSNTRALSRSGGNVFEVGSETSDRAHGPPAWGPDRPSAPDTPAQVRASVRHLRRALGRTNAWRARERADAESAVRGLIAEASVAVEAHRSH